MRKITREAIDAFLNKGSFKKSNTRITTENNLTCMILHGNIIALLHDDNSIHISTCGWDTRVTLERLNGIPNVSIRMKQGTLYLNNKEWDGKTIKI